MTCYFFGTFNPIHNGHIEMAKVAYRQFQLDKVLFMPSGNSYLKQNVLNQLFLNYSSILLKNLLEILHFT